MMFKRFKQLLGLTGFALLSSHLACAEAAPGANNGAVLVYVGTFTGAPANSKGIYLFSMAPPYPSGALGPLGVAAKTASPTFLALDTKRRLLFCANEIDTFQGKPNGAVSAFSIDASTGTLKFINQQPSMGTHPCHLVLDKSGRNLLVANYNSGSVAVLPVDSDGRIEPATSVFQDAGKSINPSRQAGPHAHCVALSPDNRFAFVCDLGIDKVMSFKFDAKHGKLAPNNPPFVSVKAGSGPRHLVFSPDGKYAYLICEMGSTITTYAYDADAGALKELQSISSLPASFHGTNAAAEIAIDPSGKFLFASNRAHNSVAQFEIDREKGTLQWMDEQSTAGKTPRFFAVAPSGRQLIICNQDSDTITSCALDPRTERLLPATLLADAPAPVCTVFLPVKIR